MVLRTFTVTVAVAVPPIEFAAVRVYVVVAPGFTMTLVPVTSPTLLSKVNLDAPVTSHVSLEPPGPVVAGDSIGSEAVKLAMLGRSTTVTVALAEVLPVELLAVSPCRGSLMNDMTKSDFNYDA